jgi:hypothetical protein
VTEARIIAVVGGMLAAFFAIWCAGEFYRLNVAVLHSYYPAKLDLWWVGIPLMLSYGIALFFVTRKRVWLPLRWTLRGLAAFLLRSSRKDAD